MTFSDFVSTPKTPSLKASAFSNPPLTTTASMAAPCIAAVIEGRGASSEVGFAAFNQETCQCTLAQLADLSGYARTLTLLNLHRPRQILICRNNCEVGGEGDEGEPRNRSKLHLLLEAEFDVEVFVRIPRRAFNDLYGAELLREFCLHEQLSLVHNACRAKYIHVQQSLFIGPLHWLPLLPYLPF